MARLSVEKQIVKALKEGNTELAQQLAAAVKEEVKPKTKPKAKKPAAKTTKPKTAAPPKPPKEPKLTPEEETLFEINVDSFNKKNPKILFFDDGSYKKDSQLDRKLLKGVQKTERRDPVRKLEVRCSICGRQFSEYAHNLHAVEGEEEPYGLCPKCSSSKAPR